MKKLVLYVLTLGAVLALPLMLADQAQAVIRVAVEDGTGHGSGPAVVTQLNDDTYFDFQATLVNASQIDDAGELSNYDAVILGGSGFADADWTSAMAAALRTWVQDGHCVVATGWFNFDLNGDEQPEDSDLEAIVPFPNGPSTNEFQTPGTIDILVNHPVTAGLSDFSTGASYTEVDRQGTESDDTVLAAMVGAQGDLSIGVKDPIGSGRSVYLGPIYMADPSTYGTGPLRSGDSDKLLEQAVAWCGGSPSVPVKESTWGQIKATYR
jgi:hypothetical protein